MRNRLDNPQSMSNRPPAPPNLTRCGIDISSGAARFIPCLLSFVLTTALLPRPCAATPQTEPSQTESEALNWLSGMRQAAGQSSYKGIIAFSRNGQVESFQLFHSVTAGIERERLVSMNSPLREVMRNAEKVVCYYPDTKTAFVENKPSRHSILLDLPEDLSQLTRYYRINPGNREYIAQRQAQAISMVPRDDYRYARRIWLDVESRLPLKSELIDESGNNVEQMIFTSLELNPDMAASDLESSIPGNSVKWEFSQGRCCLRHHSTGRWRVCREASG